MLAILDDTKEYWRLKLVKYKEQGFDKVNPIAAEFVTYLKPHSKILELGTGLGQDALFFASHGHEVWATDFISNRFDEINKKSKEGHMDLYTDLLNIENKFPYENNFFDAVYAHLVLHYYTDNKTKEVFSEIARVLKRSGVVGFVFNSYSDPERAECEELEDKLYLHMPTGLIKRFFKMEEIEALTGPYFNELLLDDKGQSLKDTIKSTYSLVRFIGQKK